MIQTIKLTEGKDYKIIKDGAFLSWEESIGPYAWQGKSYALKIGDVVTYVGMKMGWGSDNIHQDNFSCGNARGSFWPQDWGSADTSFMEEI